MFQLSQRYLVGKPEFVNVPSRWLEGMYMLLYSLTYYYLVPRPNCSRHCLSNEFNFSEGYRSVNYIGSSAKRMNPKQVHVNFASDPL